MKIDKDLPEGNSTVAQGVKKFDFSNTRDLSFIHTIGGTYLNSESQTNGYPMLSKAVRYLGLQSKPGEPMQVDLAASSIAALTEDRLDTMFSALRGIVNEPKPPSRKIKAEDHERDKVPLRNRFRIFFPSQRTVENSKGGPEV